MQLPHTWLQCQVSGQGCIRAVKVQKDLLALTWIQLKRQKESQLCKGSQHLQRVLMKALELTAKARQQLVSTTAAGQST